MSRRRAARVSDAGGESHAHVRTPVLGGSPGRARDDEQAAIGLEDPETRRPEREALIEYAIIDRLPSMRLDQGPIGGAVDFD
jgi:hypothetical protein